MSEDNGQPYEPESIACHKPSRRCAPKVEFAKSAVAKFDEVPLGLFSRVLLASAGGLEKQRASEAFYEYVTSLPDDDAVDHKHGKGLVREALKKKNGMGERFGNPFLFLITTVLWDVLWWLWRRRHETEGVTNA